MNEPKQFSLSEEELKFIVFGLEAAANPSLVYDPDELKMAKDALSIARARAEGALSIILERFGQETPGLNS